MWCLTDFSGPNQVYIGLRDRAMLLTSSSVAFRGDNSRQLLMSDLFSCDIPINAKELGTKLRVGFFLFRSCISKVLNM